MAKTVTGELARRMAVCKREQKELLRTMSTVGSIARIRHDQLAGEIGGMEDGAQRDEANAVRNGLLATSQYADSFVEHATGQKKKEPPQHDAKGLDHKFAKKGSLSHKLRMLFHGP